MSDGERVDDPGEWLIEPRRGLDRTEAEWLERLARFDQEERWRSTAPLAAPTGWCGGRLS